MAEFKSQYPFVAFPSWILKKQIETPDWLSSKEIVVLLSLQSFADGMKEDQGVYPSIERLCAMTGICKRTIIEVMKTLQEKGLITKSSRYKDGERKTNLYTLKIWNYSSPFENNLENQGLEGGPEQGAGSALRGEPRCKNRDPKCKNRPFLGAGDAPKQEPLNKNQEEEPEGARSAIRPSLPPLSGKNKNKKLDPKILPELPVYAEPYRSYLQDWWTCRYLVHKQRATQVLTKQTVAALELAKQLDVLQEFCEHASTKSWISLGFAGYTDYIQKLAKDKKFVPGGQNSYFQPRPPVNMETHPSYRPLAIDEASECGGEDGGFSF